MGLHPFLHPDRGTNTCHSSYKGLHLQKVLNKGRLYEQVNSPSPGPEYCLSIRRLGPGKVLSEGI